MDSLSSLLIGFYILLSYSCSQRHTHTQRWVVGGVTRTTELIRTRCWCLFHRDKGHVHIIKNIGSRLENAFYSKVFLKSYFSLTEMVL
jgi:hypothetical protein